MHQPNARRIICFKSQTFLEIIIRTLIFMSHTIFLLDQLIFISFGLEDISIAQLFSVSLNKPSLLRERNYQN